MHSQICSIIKKSSKNTKQILRHHQIENCMLYIIYNEVHVCGYYLYVRLTNSELVWDAVCLPVEFAVESSWDTQVDNININLRYHSSAGGGELVLKHHLPVSVGLAGVPIGLNLSIIKSKVLRIGTIISMYRVMFSYMLRAQFQYKVF